MASFPIDRRSLLSAAVLAAASRTAIAQTDGRAAAPETLDLWPGPPPDGPGPAGPERINAKGAISRVSRPRLILHRPAVPSGTAVIVVAGGGYTHIETATEGQPACRWLQAAGVTAFELIYRMPKDGWPKAAPFQDGQRAIRIVRARAASFRVDPARIGMIGFSAGGHLAGMTAVRPTAALYRPVDPSDQASARPDFAGLIYPVLTMMPPFDHTHSSREIVGTHPSEAERAAYSVERQVGPETPPIFLAQAGDDPISPIDNSLMMFAALRAAGIAAELHVFQTGGHGWGLGRPGAETQAWPALFANWAALGGFMAPRPL